MQRGYIKIWRKLEDSGLLQMHGTLALFMYILMKATHKPTKIGTPIGVIELERGQYISGRHKLSAAVGLSEREIRTCVARLEELDVISVKTTSRFSVYTIVNYNNYQDNDQQNDQQETNKRPTNDQQTTTKQELINTTSIKEESISLVASDAGRSPCPHEKIIEVYHRVLPELPSIRRMDSTRKSTLQARWRESEKHQTIEFWEKYFTWVRNFPFYLGENDRKWKADFSWLINSKNFTKILEKELS